MAMRRKRICSMGKSMGNEPVRLFMDRSMFSGVGGMLRKTWDTSCAMRFEPRFTSRIV